MLDARGVPFELDPTPRQVALPLAFVIPDRIEGYSRIGDPIAGVELRMGDTPRDLYSRHRCPKQSA